MHPFPVAFKMALKNNTCSFSRHPLHQLYTEKVDRKPTINEKPRGTWNLSRITFEKCWRRKTFEKSRRIRRRIMKSSRSPEVVWSTLIVCGRCSVIVNIFSTLNPPIFMKHYHPVNWGKACLCHSPPHYKLLSKMSTPPKS